jgi:hypothetical protein
MGNMSHPKQPPPSIVVTPKDASIDVARQIELRGFPAGEASWREVLRFPARAAAANSEEKTTP